MLSVVILTRDEAKVIGRAIKSVQWAEEIIVIDDNSQDNTVSIAKSFGAITYARKLSGNFAAQRNYGLSRAKGDWLLFMDADETVSPQLAVEIRKTITVTGNKIEAYYVRRRDFFWGKEMKWGELRRVYQKGLIRLIKKESGQWTGAIHEVFKTGAPTGQLKSFINHHPHSSIKEFLHDVNFYSSLRARQWQQDGQRVNFMEIIFPPFFKFIYSFLLKQGFRDG